MPRGIKPTGPIKRYALTQVPRSPSSYTDSGHSLNAPTGPVRSQEGVNAVQCNNVGRAGGGTNYIAYAYT